MRKKILIISIISIILMINIFIVFKINDFSSKTWSLELDKDSIKSIKVKKYGVYGLIEETLVTTEEINEAYDYLVNIKIGNESKAGCEDNTKKYILYKNDDTEQIIEIECNTIIVNNKKYSIVNR